LRKISTYINNIICPVYAAFVILSCTFYGWHIIVFIISYSNLDENVILRRLSIWMTWQPWILLIFALVAISVFLLRSHFLRILFLNNKFFLRHWYAQILIVLMGLSNIYLYQLEYYIHLFNLLGISLSIYASVLIAFQIYHSDVLAWRHPTTIGSSVVSTFILGISVVILSGLFEDVLEIPVFWYIILILFDMFIFIARFRYLSVATATTRLFAKKLMGSLLLFTGIRLIIGIFMPLVYSVYMIISKQDFGQGIALMIFIGQIVDRSLFLCNPIQRIDL